mmetsp:Transcript_12299/g.16052  ORF Transcript_12299/g.16052 Transcript_12299/m.16052 type:complete len:83 (-) Transcript_12299:54-302(-)|eukprot:CAMPEP_0116054882 /NCGR_PEP_ID=MMETSP0322-20121206/3076_1 /TAXON_ID=163516 /ORGANISM="Leptocylindrus danicus var. apora, Strain B651" /LENGTH=82 /DNA_ID=CAMNT_0003538379 /DNA_START=29 /DNA_END=277 /DNA_ORIENTATION=+
MSGKPAARPSAGGRPAGSRAGGARRATGAARGGAAQQKTNGILSFYQDDSPGLKVGPTTVLVTSLSFVGIVVILHIMGKFLS